MNKRKFDPDIPRYITGGIHARLPPGLQQILWVMIDMIPMVLQPDYLQVFELKAIGDEGEMVQTVRHFQEVPPYERIYYFPAEDGEGITGKIYAIDDGDHATMLWADEY